MRTNDLEELDILVSRSNLRSLDPAPNMETGMDPRVLRDRISEHIGELKRLSVHLPRSATLDAAIDNLSQEYEKLLGRRLTELKSSPKTKAAVLDLRRQLSARIKEPDPDLSYRGIDMLMQRICKAHDCQPSDLHDSFVSTFLVTPDKWAKDQLNN